MDRIFDSILSELAIHLCGLVGQFFQNWAYLVERTSVEQHQVSARVADWVGWAKLCLGIFILNGRLGESLASSDLKLDRAYLYQIGAC